MLDEYRPLGVSIRWTSCRAQPAAVSTPFRCPSGTPAPHLNEPCHRCLRLLNQEPDSPAPVGSAEPTSTPYNAGLSRTLIATVAKSDCPLLHGENVVIERAGLRRRVQSKFLGQPVSALEVRVDS